MDRNNFNGLNYSDYCSNELKNRAWDIILYGGKNPPKLCLVAECISNNVTNPFTNQTYTKEQLGGLIVGFDIATIVFLILFAWI